MNTALMLLKDNVVIIGFLLAVWASWKVARWTKGVDASIQQQAQNIERLTENVQNLTNSFSRLETRVATLSEKIDTQVDALSKKIDTQIATLSAAMSDRMDTRFAALSDKVDGFQHMFTVFLDRPPVAKSTSPRTLTDYGTKLSLEIDAPSLAAHYAAGLRDKIGSMNAWQIQELCFNHAENEIMNDLQQHDIDRYNQITMCACWEGIDLSQVMRVVGLVMRDQLLQQTGQLPRAQTAPAFPGGDSTLGMSHA